MKIEQKAIFIGSYLNAQKYNDKKKKKNLRKTRISFLLTFIYCDIFQYLIVVEWKMLTYK